MAKFQVPILNTFRDMNYFPLFLVQSGQTDRLTDGQTESDAYEPTVQFVQVGSKSVSQNFDIPNKSTHHVALRFCKWFNSQLIIAFM